jgi:hypothetical protein
MGCHTAFLAVWFMTFQWNMLPSSLRVKWFRKNPYMQQYTVTSQRTRIFKYTTVKISKLVVAKYVSLGSKLAMM